MPAPRQFPRRAFGGGVRLAAMPTTDAGATPANPRWIQVAYEGKFVYRGRPVTFDRALFDTLIANFHANPAFHAGADGVGDANVVHFDYEHVSEMDPREGSVPAQGTPAPAWALDLQVRDGADGQAQLWALAKLGKTVLAQITADPPEYQWTSVAIAPSAADPVTGDDIGPLLTSIAFTNDPFLQGMVPISIAASMWIDKAESPEQAVIGLRDIFGLEADADVEQIRGQLQKLADLVTSGAEPEGVEIDNVISSIRRLLALPTLATRDEVIAAAATALSYDPNRQPAPGGAATTPAETAMPEPTTNLTKRLAAVFRVNEHDELVVTAAEKAMTFTKNLATRLKVAEHEDMILAAVDQAAGAKDAMDSLMGILGGADFKAALENAKSLVAKTSGMGEIVAQLAAAMERIGQIDTQDAQAETEAVVASRVAQMQLSGNAAKVAADTLRPGILALRMACIAKDAKDTVGAAERLAEFRKTYPLPDADRALLTRRIFAGEGGSQIGLRADHAGNLQQAPIGVSAQQIRADGRSPERVTLCAAFQGRNDTERAVAYLCKEQPGFEKLDRGEQVHRAGEWLRAAAN